MQHKITAHACNTGLLKRRLSCSLCYHLCSPSPGWQGKERKESLAIHIKKKEIHNTQNLEVVLQLAYSYLQHSLDPLTSSLDILQKGKNSGYNWLLEMTKDHINHMPTQSTELTWYLVNIISQYLITSALILLQVDWTQHLRIDILIKSSYIHTASHPFHLNTNTETGMYLSIMATRQPMTNTLRSPPAE